MQKRIPPRMAGVLVREVKEEGRRFFGPGDMDGDGYPPPLAPTDMR